MEETNETKSFMTTAEDFVEGGLQDACDDACSICLEPFRESDPSSVTNCKHEFHLQCILEWCQRSSQCPMCWQFVSLKDPESQELLDAVKLETKRAVTQRRNHHNFGETELQQLMIDADDNEIEEYILRHLAAATAMGRNQRHGRRGYDQVQSSSHGRPRFLVFSTHSNTPPSGTDSPSPNQIRGDAGHVLRNSITPSPPHVYDGGGGSASQGSPYSNDRIIHRSTSPSASRSMLVDTGTPNILSQSASHNQDEAGPSEFQSFTESLKSRLNAVSMRYKESISKSTRGWKEKLFSRSASSIDVDSENRRGMDTGITSSSSHVVEKEETRDAHSPAHSSFSRHQGNYTADHNIQNSTHGNSPSNDSIATASHSTDSVSL